MTTRIAVAAPFILLLAACSSGAPAQPPIETSNGTTAPEDAGFVVQSDGGLYCPPSAATSCNTLGLCGRGVLVEQVAENPPDGVGGTLTPGTYVLSSYVNYTGFGGATGGTSVWFRDFFTVGSTGAGDEEADADTSAGSTTFAYEDAIDSSQLSSPVWSTGTLTTQGSSIVIQYACSGLGTDDASFTYTATSTTITMIFAQNAIDGTGVVAYTRVD